MSNILSDFTSKMAEFNELSDFKTKTGLCGGYVSLQNSGRRGTIKSFTLSLPSIRQALIDIKENSSHFLNYYDETPWRDAFSGYLKDEEANSLSTVQTKPLFSTLSKIINWANGKNAIDDGDFDLSNAALDKTIGKLDELIRVYTVKDNNFVGIVETHFLNTPLPKPFLLLAGISGTGKTRFVRKQANMAADQAGIPREENHCCISVRPDWHEPSDLLGYVSRISGTAEYVPTLFLQFIVTAWKYATDDNGEILPFENQIPFWLCLDEMNLAPVEQYFADYLSVLESRTWEDGVYRCNSLLSSVILKETVEDILKLKKCLKLDDTNSKSDKLWKQFTKTGIAIPPNLIVAGTVNMDETTHGFSRKVIDRALTFDFGEFFPNSFDEYFSPKAKVKPFGIFNESQIGLDNRSLLANVPSDPDGEKTILFLNDLNSLLTGTPFELAFRALNEILLSLLCFKPKDDKELNALWDDFLMMKVLPRIDGDTDKLSSVKAVSSISTVSLKELEMTQDDSNLLVQIYDHLASKLVLIWQGDESRPDLFRTSATESTTTVLIPCRSRKKISWMIKRLKTNGFTSFWP